MRDRAATARRQLRQYEARYQKLVQFISSQFPPNVVQQLETATRGSVTGIPIDDLAVSITALAGGARRLSPIARLIEETLLLTPWNLSKECLEVTMKQGGQFSLDGIGDPSGGRGEGLSLIRLQVSTKG